MTQNIVIFKMQAEDVSIIARHFKYNRVGYILTLGVAKSYRSIGLGSYLLSQTLENLEDQNCMCVYLHVLKANKKGSVSSENTTSQFRRFGAYGLKTSRNETMVIRLVAIGFYENRNFRQVGFQSDLSTNHNPLSFHDHSGKIGRKVFLLWGVRVFTEVLL